MSYLDQYISNLDGLIQQLSPQATRQLTRELGQEMRRRNAARIKANVQPDGAAYLPRQGYGWKLRQLKPNETLKPGQKFNFFKERDLSLKFVRDKGNRFVGEDEDGCMGGFLKKFIYIKTNAKKGRMFRKMANFKWLKTKNNNNEAAFGFMSGIVGQIAAEHQAGNDAINLPAHELIGFSADDLRVIQETIIAYLAKS